MKKNAAGQVIGAQMTTIADGSDFTDPVTVYITGDNGSQAIGSVGSGIATHKGRGYHSYAPSQAESNFDHAAFTFSAAGAVTATPQTYTNFPQSADVAPIATDILAQVTGTGNRVITIHVQDTVAAPIAEVLVRIGTASAYTGTSGNAVFALDDGSYDVILRKDFVVFTVPESLTVAGDATHPYTGTLFAPAVPTQPGTCVVYGNVIDIGVDPVLGATIEIKETNSSTFSNAQKIVADKQTTSDVDGYWQIEVIRSSGLVPVNSPYLVVIENGNGSFRRVETITVPDADSAEYSTIIDS